MVQRLVQGTKSWFRNDLGNGSGIGTENGSGNSSGNGSGIGLENVSRIGLVWGLVWEMLYCQLSVKI